MSEKQSRGISEVIEERSLIITNYNRQEGRLVGAERDRFLGFDLAGSRISSIEHTNKQHIAQHYGILEGDIIEVETSQGKRNFPSRVWKLVAYDVDSKAIFIAHIDLETRGKVYEEYLLRIAEEKNK